MRVARFLAVRPQAFEQAAERRLVSRQACCPLDVGLGPGPIGMPLTLCAVRRVITKGHCLLPLKWLDRSSCQQGGLGSCRGGARGSVLMRLLRLVACENRSHGDATAAASWSRRVRQDVLAFGRCCL